ncbi:MAG: IS110 family transposase [Coriobacteriia bacterium]|nr:IS110 family transposase [Coriobacteriia bacterium]
MIECTHIGLDVHKETIAVAVLRPGGTEVDERVIPNTPEAIRKLLRKHRDVAATRICYEAGPSGYDTHRLITSLGYPCDVIAPSLIPRRSGVRVKTDRIDARNLARLHRAGELSCVRVPTPAEEAVRALIRVREEVKADRRVARQRIRSFLTRYGKRYPHANDKWSHRFEVWARAVRFEEPCAQEAFEHLLAAYFVRDAQLAAMGRRIEELAGTEPLAVPVALLGALRGIGTLTAMTIIAETCDFSRFPDAGAYMAFTGLTPSEHSSGASRHQGSITKTGNRHIRRVLVEAAWAYRHAPAVRGKLKVRLEGQAPEVVAYSWAAQCRCHGTFRRVAARKGAHAAVVATARELAGFVWGLSTGNTAMARWTSCQRAGAELRSDSRQRYATSVSARTS